MSIKIFDKWFNIFDKWFNKMMKGVEGYEGISCESGRLVHSLELHVAELEVIGVKLWKKGHLVNCKVWSANEMDSKSENLRIIVKKNAELLITTESDKTIWYFGDNEKYYMDNPSVDELLMYVCGKSGSYIIHGSIGKPIEYIANIGLGDASALMRNVFEILPSQEEQADAGQ